MVNTTGTSWWRQANNLTGTLTLARGTLDLDNAAATTNILIQSGALSQAGAYAGNASNRVHVGAVANSGNIALGGLDASQLGTVATTTAGTQLTGLKGWAAREDQSAAPAIRWQVSADNLSGAPFTGTGSLISLTGLRLHRLCGGAPRSR